MNAFHAAAREMLEADLVCKCGEENAPNRPHAIKLEDGRSDRATCDTCGAVGLISKFQRVPRFSPSTKE